jgi:hypothetical protein
MLATRLQIALSYRELARDRIIPLFYWLSSGRGIMAIVMQQTQQQSEQRAQKRIYGRPFPKGRSGNPTGRTNVLDRIADLCAMFEATYGRPPSPLDMISIRTAPRLAAACASPNTNAEQSVRASNALHKTLTVPSRCCRWQRTRCASGRSSAP